MNCRKNIIFLGLLGALLVGFGLGFVVQPIYQIAAGIFIGRPIQALISTDFRHTAVLSRKDNLADINFRVNVDGVRVFESPDLMPFPDHLYRETLIWDKSGTVLVFEMMGRRVFAYNADEKRKLIKGEIAKYEFFPALTDNYFYATVSDIEEEK